MKNIFLLAACVVLAACSAQMNGQGGSNTITVFEGARLITGDGSAPIENSAFVVQGTTFTRVGRRGEVPVPAGTTREPGRQDSHSDKVDLHGHGYQHD
jgi:hypothetical protein